MYKDETVGLFLAICLMWEQIWLDYIQIKLSLNVKVKC